MTIQHRVGRVRIPLVILLSTLLLSAAAGTALAAMQCYDCHGVRQDKDMRPRDDQKRDASTGGFPGNHRAHLPTNAQKADCAVCHPGSDSYTSSHRNGVIELSSRLNKSPSATAYNNMTTPSPQSSASTQGSCSSVNCHFEKSTPAWGSSPLAPTACDTCHGAPPADGSHGKKHGEYYGTGIDSCSKCHVDHSAEANPLSHALEAGNRPLSVQFPNAPNNGGTYTGTTAYPQFLPSQNPSRNGTCTNLYCHSDGMRRSAVITPKWSDNAGTKCYSCHRGRAVDNSLAACNEMGGTWDVQKKLCTPYVNMTSNGHGQLVGAQWVRKYPCHYCHYATVDEAGNIKDKSKHVNGSKDVQMSPQWSMVGRPAPSYDPVTKVCDNVYCHSDGTTSPDAVKPFAWYERKTECNTCHGHPRGSCANANCHDGRIDSTGKVWTVKSGWKTGEEWKAAIPMFSNEGPGTSRANSHPRHTETNFTCDQCHVSTVLNGTCTDCHTTGIPAGSMSEVAHIDARFHVNKTRDVVFKGGGNYDPIGKTCSNTACHTGGSDPVWGGSVNSNVICLSCHGTTNGDIDSFGFFQTGVQTKINLTEWATTGHGRKAADGPYPGSGNPPANFPGNPCWYCHDNNVLHKDSGNPFRLRQHLQFSNRFEKECVYCHMTGTDSECLGCHSNTESLAPQLASTEAITKHGGTVYNSGCRSSNCHDTDARLHQSGADFWTADQKADVKNQYLMMGVCLKCHDDDSGDKCNSCHTAPANNPLKYTLGFDPGTGFIKPQKARASSVHFGYKHNRAYMKDGIWKGGKFCWDCHDPHGDKNIYMVQTQVATSTDGKFGIPQSRATVSFTRKQSGLDYARTVAPYNGICNVCHSAGSQHYRSDGGDSHNSGRICTQCHEHRFADSHADKMACNSCHMNKPVPRHSGFGLPRDCTKCHFGTIGKRVDVMGQFGGTSHHVQGVNVSNRHCYACHWESTPEGLIDNRYHEGYNYKTYSSAKNSKVDLVVWGPGTRPTNYKTYSTAIQYTAAKLSYGNVSTERKEVAKLNTHCISCHSDKNNNSQPFGDCRTPRQYAWDKQSIAARYSQTGSAPWGKYGTNGKAGTGKAFSAHGNATANQGGFDSNNGLDSTIPNLRGGAYNVNCYDCHNSHGSRVVGTTSSYATFNGTRNGGNLKETQAGKGGYTMTYKAAANSASGAINPYNAGAGQCFDCHMTQNSGTTPWGYASTFGALQPIKGYFDSNMFGQDKAPYMSRPSNAYKTKPIAGGHFKASKFLNHTTGMNNKINGLCTPCHDPHGTSPTLGSKQAYAVPMLKGTWMTSPYTEDAADPNVGGGAASHVDIRTMVAEDDTKFAGLCLRCHYQKNLTDGVTHTWKDPNRVHESVKGWKTANGTIQHTFTCSKCHTPHTSGLPRLMVTNCLDFQHRGRVASGGYAGAGADSDRNGTEHYEGPGSGNGSFPKGSGYGTDASANCHPTGTWPDNYWNVKTKWPQ